MHNINRPILYYHVFLRPGGGFHVTRPALEFGGRYCWSTIWWWMQLSFGSDLGNSGAKIGQLDGQPWRFLDGLSKMIQPRFMCFICGLLDPILVLIWFFWRVPHQKKKASRRLGRFSSGFLKGFVDFSGKNKKAPRSIPSFVDAWFILCTEARVDGPISRHTVQLGPKLSCTTTTYYAVQ